jgi:L-lactate dehydrogenase complex protein LldF
MAAASRLLMHPRLYATAGATARLLMRGPRWLMGGSLNPWLRQRDLPRPPRKSFREIWKEQQS